MQSLLHFLFQVNALPFWGLVIGIPALGFAIRWHIIRMEKTVLTRGVETLAMVLDVRREESDCAVTYSFQDQKTGRTFKRTGVIGHCPNLPREGEKVAVRYLERNPGWSRMVDEIPLASI